jgi:hypothetical protein
MTCIFYYYKQSGKFYSDGRIDYPVDRFDQAVDKAKGDLNAGIRPGLVNGFHFNVLLEVHAPQGPMTALLIRGINIIGTMD